MSDTESFKQAMAEMVDKVASPYWIAMAARMKAAHDREIRDVSQREFARGMDAGQHSMDAEHRAIAMRLRGLRFDGGSHENLVRIAYAIYPCATGWTCESAAGLRDMLIDLMGGVSDDTCGAGCYCAAADSDCDCGLQREEVSDNEYSVSDSPSSSRSGGTNRNDSRSRGCRNRHHTPPKELEVSDGGTADDYGADSRGGSRGKLVHMDGLVAYDVLDNERHKAVCELRKLNSENFGCKQFMGDLLSAIDPDWISKASMYDDATLNEYMRDRLIHLLGGDKPSGIDVLREMDADGTSSNDDGTCPNDVPIASITDELREWMSTVLTSDDYAWAIADRIDEQFDRCCELWERVARNAIHTQLKAEEERDELRDEDFKIKRQYAKLCVERADLLELLRDARDEYVNAQAVCDELRYQREELMRKWMHERAERKELQGRLECAHREIESIQYERDELRRKVDAIRDALDG